MTKVPLALALSGCSSQFLGLLSENIPATCLLSLGFTLLNVGDQPSESEGWVRHQPFYAAEFLPDATGNTATSQDGEMVMR